MAEDPVRPANAALFYHVDAFDTSRPKLMGRHAAGEGFLRGFARHGQVDVLYCYAKTEDEFRDFTRRVAELGGAERPCAWIPHNQRHELAKPGCLHIPTPVGGEYAWQRRFGDERAYSLCGVTHTTASHAIMSAIGDLLIAPFQPWDAVICPSRSVKATFDHILAHWAAYLAERLGGKPHCPVQLPIIPLGVDCDRFAPSKAAERARADMRKRHGIAKSDIAVLFMGRLSYHAKAHPFPMYVALEEVARRTGKRIHLIQAGWFGNEPIEQSFKEGARLFCPSVRALFLDGRKPEVRVGVWFAADIFASLSDNIQETFGLTPIEAMAAGLPVVVSDWDGYRESVRHGVDGFVVPTAMPPPGLGEGFAYRHLMDLDNYDRYIGYASQCTAVDVKACTEAFLTLVKDKGMRRRMGEAGRKRARELYDWRVVVAAYQDLWGELAARREREAEVAPRRDGAPAHPLRDDPFAIYGHYPTVLITPECLVSAVEGADGAALARVCAVEMNTYAGPFLAPPRAAEALLQRLQEEGPLTVSDLLGAADGHERVKMHRTVGWLAKMGLVAIAPPGGAG